MRISDWSSDVCSSDLLDERGLPKTATAQARGTTIHLSGLRKEYREQVPRSVEVLVQKLIEHFILVFLESDCPHVVLIDQGHKYDINHIFQREYKSSASSHKFQLEGHHSKIGRASMRERVWQYE